MPADVLVIDAQGVLALLPDVDMAAALRRMFASLHDGSAAQPPQSLVEFPSIPGDFITYSGVLEPKGAFGVKLSPYIARSGAPLVTAWTLLMSLHDGLPLLLCDSKRLTTERTAATTALAVDILSPQRAAILAIIGTGDIAEAHLRHVLPLRGWHKIRVASRSTGSRSTSDYAHFTARDGRVQIVPTIAQAIEGADVVLLCTSSGLPVIDPRQLAGPALVTSISTNVARAHEIPPEALPELDVFCDYRPTAPLSAGEMVIAQSAHGWSADAIIGDLPELVSGAVRPGDTRRNRFFRSTGLGLADIAIAAEIHHVATRVAKEGRL